MKLFEIMVKYCTTINGLPKEFNTKSLILSAFHIFIFIPPHNFNTLLVCP